ncbi:Putative ubiquitin-conjugating enzyme E2, ubiquitin-conjugating enzyme/RWD [Septoria linicola]|uniref:Ubiquitin-conjugating enzyme E2 Z n=1 Tax=Septoria linicola TaxID=215465 RepID=A0A9Q9AFZ8_9PEZI|nr:putative ubiquitin-conjugating enzyme E2, ubiquitin-conjugating enzyme/RWD [Septoria linicola]USW46839.1 Putative ubiquitin-conjugating enzyme E2, ubiquitin-conjugating enzyme/RWD [Septoria linicola]
MANTNGAIARITKEIAHAQKGTDLSIGVACKDSDVRNVRALIIGPPETPYEFGFFEFDMKFPKDYPIKSPQVRCMTTNSGRTRFNPNIYAEGKVCLSILGTWRGQPGEEWSSAQGLESVLISIQSLMSSNPYENEPGYETSKKEESNPAAYIAKVRHETLRVSVCQRLEGLLHIQPEKAEPPLKKIKVTPADEPADAPESPAANGTNGSSTPASVHEYDAEATYNALEQAQWDPFADVIKRRFLWYYDAYIRSIDNFSEAQRDGTAFKRMEFEYPPNSMEGHYGYKNLRSRMETILKRLDKEAESWEQQGAQQVVDATQLATQLAFQFRQLEAKWNNGSYAGSHMEISLPNPRNPFVLHLTLFGDPTVNLDGGIFNMKMYIPPDFPSTQPRVKMETPIFHHRVSSNGHLCYFPTKEDEIGSHLDAIVVSIEDRIASFDPRAMVNPETFELRWGGDDKRKVYNRKLRRSAQESRLELDPRKAQRTDTWVLSTILQRLKAT